MARIHLTGGFAPTKVGVGGSGAGSAPTLRAVTDNEQMIAFWNGAAGEMWARSADAQDVELGPLGDAVLDVLAPAAGEAVLDVGCGQGTTSRILAERVGASGRVVGVDISVQLLAMAR